MATSPSPSASLSESMMEKMYFHFITIEERFYMQSRMQIDNGEDLPALPSHRCFVKETGEERKARLGINVSTTITAEFEVARRNVKSIAGYGCKRVACFEDSNAHRTKKFRGAAENVHDSEFAALDSQCATVVSNDDKSQVVKAQLSEERKAQQTETGDEKTVIRDDDKQDEAEHLPATVVEQTQRDNAEQLSASSSTKDEEARAVQTQPTGENQALQKELVELKSALVEKEASSEKAVKEKQALQNEIKKMKAALAQNKADAEKAEQEKQAWKQETASLQAQLSKKCEEAENARTEARQVEQTQQQKVEQLQSEMQQIANREKEAQNHTQAFEKTISTLERNVAEKEQEKTSIFTSAQQEVTALRSQIAGLRDELGTAQEQGIYEVRKEAEERFRAWKNDFQKAYDQERERHTTAQSILEDTVQSWTELYGGLDSNYQDLLTRYKQKCSENDILLEERNVQLQNRPLDIAQPVWYGSGDSDAKMDEFPGETPQTHAAAVESGQYPSEGMNSVAGSNAHGGTLKPYGNSDDNSVVFQPLNGQDDVIDDSGIDVDGYLAESSSYPLQATAVQMQPDNAARALALWNADEDRIDELDTEGFVGQVLQNASTVVYLAPRDDLIYKVQLDGKNMDPGSERILPGFLKEDDMFNDDDFDINVSCMRFIRACIFACLPECQILAVKKLSKYGFNEVTRNMASDALTAIKESRGSLTVACHEREQDEVLFGQAATALASSEAFIQAVERVAEKQFSLSAGVGFWPDQQHEARQTRGEMELDMIQKVVEKRLRPVTQQMDDTEYTDVIDLNISLEETVSGVDDMIDALGDMDTTKNKESRKTFWLPADRQLNISRMGSVAERSEHVLGARQPAQAKDSMMTAEQVLEKAKKEQKKAKQAKKAKETRERGRGLDSMFNLPQSPDGPPTANRGRFDASMLPATAEKDETLAHFTR